MFRPAARVLARPCAAATTRSFPRVAGGSASKRFISTAPPTQKSRSWKSLVARLGAAGAVIYFYNTTDIFAGEAHAAAQKLVDTAESEAEQLPTIDAIAEERRRRRAEEAAIKAAYEENLRKEQQEREKQQQQQQEGGEAVAPGEGAAQLEEEADQQGAFNPETGEINWDCPCLGGMAHGPCGEDFKAAFSCFVYSTEEPKGMDCVEKFKDMQNCFRQYPEIYGSELDTDEDLDAEQPADAPAAEATSPSTEDSAAGRQERAQAATQQVRGDHADAEKKYIGPATTKDSDSDREAKKARAKAAKEQVKRNHGGEPLSEADEVVPRAAFDDREANEKE